MNNAHYVYNPIKPYQTRLMRLFRSSGALDAPLVCSLHVADLLHPIIEGLGVRSPAGDYAALYTALSYTWGGEEKPEIILCDGSELKIGANLSLALRRLREFDDDDQYLWVDAICINQSDKDEVGEQVAHMLAIYQKAAQVIAWIDSAGEEPPQELGHVLRAAQACEQQLADNRPLNCWEACRVLSYIYTRDWFRRVWVQQEVFAARELHLQSGPYRFVWNKLLADPTLIREMAGPMTNPYPDVAHTQLATHNPNLIEELNRQHRSGPESFEGFLRLKTSPDLLWTLLRTHNLGATNPLDQIFGVLGISTFPTKAMSIQHWIAARQTSILIPIDYTADMSAILTTVTWAILMQHGTRTHTGIDFLPHSLCVIADYKIVRHEVRDNTCRSPLPSWVVDWKLAGAFVGEPHGRNKDLNMLRSDLHLGIGEQLRTDNMSVALSQGKLILRGFVDDRFRFKGNRVCTSKTLSLERLRRIYHELGDKIVWKLHFNVEPQDQIVFLVAMHYSTNPWQWHFQGTPGIWVLRPCHQDNFKLMAFLAWAPEPKHEDHPRPMPIGQSRLRIDREVERIHAQEFTLPVEMDQILNGRKFTIV